VKIHILWLVGLLVCLTTVAAREGYGIEVDAIGVKAGLSYSQVDMVGYGGSEWSIGPSGGPFIAIALSPVTSLETSVVYSRRNGEYHDRSSSPGGSLTEVDEATVELEYLDFSLLLRHKPFGVKKYSPVLIIGPSWGDLLSSKYTEDDWIASDWTGRSDWAFMIGVGAERTVGASTVLVDLLCRCPVSGADKSLGGYAVEAIGFNLLLGVGF
jgi:hypothetical protein